VSKSPSVPPTRNWVAVWPPTYSTQIPKVIQISSFFGRSPSFGVSPLPRFISWNAPLFRKPHRAPLKVALILEAERMCIQQAESANAFLKTLAEPPDHSLLLPTSDRLEALLPSIRPRCLTFPVIPGLNPEPIPGIDDLIRDGSSPPSRMPWVRIAALRFCSPFF